MLKFAKVILILFPLWLPTLWILLDKYCFIWGKLPGGIIQVSIFLCVVLLVGLFASEIEKSKLSCFIAMWFGYILLATIVLFFSGGIAIISIYGP